MSETSASVLKVADLLRIAGWICVNGIAAWLGGSVICRDSPQVTAVTLGVVLGVLQSTAVSRSWREALAWAALTTMALTLAVFFAIVPIFLADYGVFHEVWIAGALLGLAVGAALGIAQGAVFQMRDEPGRVIGIWTLGNSAAGAIVGAVWIAVPRSGCGPQDLAVAAGGAAFGALTALPLAVILIRSR